MVEIKNKKITKIDSKLKKLATKISKYEKIRMPRTTIVRLKKKHTEIDTELNKLIARRLLIENNDFNVLANKSYELLKNGNLVFKTTAQQMSLTGTHATELKGRLHRNGHIYCYVKKTNFPILNFFSEYSFPSSFDGNIDCLGNITLTKSSTDYALFNRVPTKLEGEITSKGKVKVYTTKRDQDWLFGGKHVISQIISEYTFWNNKAENEFFENKKKLEDLIRNFKKEITSH
ncbi:hypothetical protein [Carboxylicivirga sp. N1Y90]|uniref:hypothetical protein n=1 Tax=Carboxylicivirga fragile TaxID=3417571 RepID=UPI003D3365D4|nr:hypothetical protein [Marinilabiliaceae bacterium N1Y90]